MMLWDKESIKLKFVSTATRGTAVALAQPLTLPMLLQEKAKWHLTRVTRFILYQIQTSLAVFNQPVQRKDCKSRGSFEKLLEVSDGKVGV